MARNGGRGSPSAAVPTTAGRRARVVPSPRGAQDVERAAERCRRGRGGSRCPSPRPRLPDSKPRPSSSISRIAPVRSPAERHATGRRLGVAPDVRERLSRDLHHVRRDRGQLRGDPASTSTTVTTPERCSNSAPELTQRLIQLAIGQDPRPEAEDVVAQIADRAVDVLDGPFDPDGDPLILRERGRPLEAHPHGEERLDHPVVELLRDPLALIEDLEPADLVLRVHHVLVQPGVLDGDPGLRGQDLRARARRRSRTRRRPASRSRRCCRRPCRERGRAPRAANASAGGGAGIRPTGGGRRSPRAAAVALQ